MSGEMFGDRQRPMVLVLGLGESGLAIARWCARHGCRLRIADTREAPPNLAALQAEGIDAEFVDGAFTPALLDRSPAVLLWSITICMAVAGFAGVFIVRVLIRRSAHVHPDPADLRVAPS